MVVVAFRYWVVEGLSHHLLLVNDCVYEMCEFDVMI
jgi:hypothetical protein